MAITEGEFCRTIQQDLNSLAGNNYPAMMREQTGYLDSLNSGENMATVTAKPALELSDGKTRKAIVEYIQPGNFSETYNSIQDHCAGGVEVTPQHEVVEITNFRQSPVLLFTKANLRTFCDAPSEHRAKIVASNMSALFRSINRDLLALAGAAATEPLDTTGITAGVKDIDIIDSVGSQPQALYNGEITILEDFADLSVAGRPILVGAGNLSRYARLQGVGCCNDFGVDNSQIGAYSYYRDRDVDQVIGDPVGPPIDINNILAYAPGSAAFVNHLDNAGEFRMTAPGVYEDGTIVDPITGIELDFKLKYDDCNEVWRMMFYSRFSLWTLPTTMFKATDERDGINYLFKYRGNTAT